MQEANLKTIPFSGTVEAGSELTLACPLISSPFRIVDIVTSFPLNTNRTVQQKFFVSDDDNEPTSGEPSGFNILDEFGQVDYVVGDDEQKLIRHSFYARQGNAHVKVYANNTDSFDHTVDVIITIELFERN